MSYHHPGHVRQQAIRYYSSPASTPQTTASQHGVHNARPQMNGSAVYPPQEVQANVETSVQQQQHRHPDHHQPQMQLSYMRHNHGRAAPPPLSKQHKSATSSAVTTLLPYCTAEVPLSESQVIAVTDVAGSLKELVLLALGAKDGNEECLDRFQSALGGGQAAAGVVDFFGDEFEIG